MPEVRMNYLQFASIQFATNPSLYLIVRNVPALGCGDELSNLFASYGEVEECKPMDAEDCEPYTDVYWIKFRQVNNARFAKRKLDEYIFLGNKLQVSYGSQFESLSDTKEKLEGRRRDVLARLNREFYCNMIILSTVSFTLKADNRSFLWFWIEWLLISAGRQKGSAVHSPGSSGRPLMGGIASPPNVMSQPVNYGKR
ncbi:hypothetical protein RJ639_006960 [Escallonia herrerae]|uniref:RNA-binding protein 48 n=1 Tax=Escallonia herrerae TaxID=1293975 RepID=A0AA88VZ51_9ASTE|nr:hypothetical protein RJ639_006960 [Escallonia herrerae]